MFCFDTLQKKKKKKKKKKKTTGRTPEQMRTRER